MNKCVILLAKVLKWLESSLHHNLSFEWRVIKERGKSIFRHYVLFTYSIPKYSCYQYHNVLFHIHSRSFHRQLTYNLFMRLNDGLTLKQIHLDTMPTIIVLFLIYGFIYSISMRWQQIVHLVIFCVAPIIFLMAAGSKCVSVCNWEISKCIQ